MTWNALEMYCLIVNGYSLSELVQDGLMQWKSFNGKGLLSGPDFFLNVAASDKQCYRN